MADGKVGGEAAGPAHAGGRANPAKNVDLAQRCLRALGSLILYPATLATSLHVTGRVQSWPCHYR